MDWREIGRLNIHHLNLQIDNFPIKWTTWPPKALPSIQNHIRNITTHIQTITNGPGAPNIASRGASIAATLAEEEWILYHNTIGDSKNSDKCHFCDI